MTGGYSMAAMIVKGPPQWGQCSRSISNTRLSNRASQPMGFYVPAQLVQDTRRHGVEVRPIDVGVGDWDCTLEGTPPALRLGLRMVKGLSRAGAERITAARPFRDVRTSPGAPA